MRDRATVYAGLLKADGLEELELGPIDLSGDGTLTRGYESANVAAIYYDTNSIPHDAALRADLERFLGLYRRLVEANDHLADADSPAETAGEEDAEQLTPGVEARRMRWHLRAERNPKLVADAKRVHGDTCAVCRFNYAARYGELGEGYIEAHHLTPLAGLQGRPTQLDPRHDFAVVCASCHRMIHRRRPPYSLDDIGAAWRQRQLQDPAGR